MSDAIVKFIEQEVDGKKWKFNKLSPRDRAVILKRLQDERRPKFLAAMEKQGIKGEEYVNEVDAYDQQHRTIDDLVRYINGPIGQAEIIEIAFKKANPDGPTDVLDNLTLDNDTTANFAFALACIKVVFKPIVSTNNTTTGQGEQASPEDESQRPSVPASSNQ